MQRQSPCRECPFLRTSLRGYVGGHDDIMEIFQLISHDRAFPCHMETNKIKKHLLKTMGDADDDPLGITDEQAYEMAVLEAEHCVGALIFMNQSAKRSRDPRITELQDAVPETDPRVLGNARELMEHHRSKAWIEMQAILAKPPAERKPTPKKRAAQKRK
jgi:hypothetical protein